MHNKKHIVKMTKIEESFCTLFVETMSRTIDLNLVSMDTVLANQNHEHRFQYVVVSESFLITQVVCFLLLRRKKFQSGSSRAPIVPGTIGHC